jgi:hypothetical protein
MHKHLWALATTLVGVCLLTAGPANAVPYEVTGAGNFGSTIPNTAYSAANGTWYFDFFIDSNAGGTLTPTYGGFDVTAAISGFQYKVNGSPVSVDPIIAFYPPSQGSGANLELSGGNLEDPDNGFVYFTAQILGNGASTSDIQLLLGLYPIGANSFFRTGNNDNSDITGTITVAVATPLPSTWVMLISGFVGIGFFAYRGTKRHRVALAAT